MSSMGIGRRNRGADDASARTVPRSLLAAVLACGTWTAACGDDQDPAGARDLHARIQSANYRSWRRAPGYEKRRKSNAPHSDAVDIYVNDVVATALDAAKPLAEWPAGSIIAKDGFDGDEHELTAIMEKRSDGWYWAEYFDGESKYSGKPRLCIDCHASGQDHVRAFGLPK